MRRPPFTLVGAAGVSAGCAGMVAMLPGAAAGALGAIGLTGSSALARTLSPVAEPLFVASAVLVLVGALACGRLVALFAIGGTTLLYLSMFQLASNGSSGARPGGSMPEMSQPHYGSPPLHADTTSFYLGLSLLVVAFALSASRRRRRECRPLIRPRPALR